MEREGEKQRRRRGGEYQRGRGERKRESEKGREREGEVETEKKDRQTERNNERSLISVQLCNHATAQHKASMPLAQSIPERCKCGSLILGNGR